MDGSVETEGGAGEEEVLYCFGRFVARQAGWVGNCADAREVGVERDVPCSQLEQNISVTAGQLVNELSVRLCWEPPIDWLQPFASRGGLQRVFATSSSFVR